MPRSDKPFEPSSRNKILETAEALFARHGFSGVGMRSVAEHVGLSKSSLFHHFPTKLHLYASVLERGMIELDRRLEQAESLARDAREKLELWVDCIVDALAEHPTRAPLLLRSLFEDEVLEPTDQERLDRALEPVLLRVAATLEQGIEAGQFRAVSIPHTIQTLIGMIVYHFASGEFGDDLMGAPVFSSTEIRKRKDHVKDFLRYGLFREPLEPEGDSR